MVGGIQLYKKIPSYKHGLIGLTSRGAKRVAGGHLAPASRGPHHY